MASIELEQVTFTYPDADRPALSRVSLRAAHGEFVVLCGASGSGKSTLLRLIKREVSPGGRVSGAIRMDGMPVERWASREAAAAIGLVMQHPDNQMVVDTVEHELAFGMENLGLERNAMRRRMAEMAGFFGLEPLLSRRTDELSGGQKQLVNLAAVLMLQPRVLLLDEPMAQLDPLAARELLGMIKRLNEEWAMTVILSEHRIDELLPLADRIVRLDRGEVAFDGTPRAYAREAVRRSDPAWRLSLPAVTRWALERETAASRGLEPPLSVKEARSWLEASGERPPAPGVAASSMPPAGAHPKHLNQALLTAEGVFFAYDKHAPAVLQGLEWELRAGDWAVLFGGNGSGKSTLLQLLAGLRQPQRGKVRLAGAKLSRISPAERYAAIGYLTQNPVLHYAHDTLREDLRQAARHAGLPDPAAAAERAAEDFGLAALLDRHPHDLSGGEQQLGALAMTLMSRPRLLLLDEPTKGLDPLAKLRLAEHLTALHRQGTTLLLATHDVEFAASYATRCSLLFGGVIVADGAPDAFFQDNLFYATSLHRLFRTQGRAAEGAGAR
ncbi:ABC transporter ATP-binding protein [Cohnella nanjingensis]|uniref:ATP-binding cassette domain-containing protein n=1 Tax=Cohnella nanjingensis TaxID=1387779 RepID=A0A7X0RML0_9BACL|nr:ABC transporter ATP-binding protein [Cohnella nanjingensis]MBB6670317.1 ATP-binding cassette domain-containing protein [Cohnella nanjingensis]